MLGAVGQGRRAFVEHRWLPTRANRRDFSSRRLSRDGTTESELVAALFGVVGSAVVSFPFDVFFLA